MNATHSLSSKKVFFSEDEKTQGYKEYVSTNKIKIEEKSKKIAYANDYPLSMTNGDLFSKFSREYIKNIIFQKGNLKFKENVEFNFFDYIKIFTQSEHSKGQKELF